MPNLPDASLPILASPFSPATTAKVILCGMISLPLIGTSLYYASPARLTLVLSDAMSNLEKVYADMVCSRILRLLPCNEVEHLGSRQPSHLAAQGRQTPDRNIASLPVVAHNHMRVSQRSFINLVRLHQRGAGSGDTHQDPGARTHVMVQLHWCFLCTCFLLVVT
ncbi:hypothetical protein C8F04DRAFT_1229252 [Mycena alexandri]|uniref:Uncharacterized protein n=1 Tax=Mycena alexandri TaxID=1745969 RepID=A0AAD6XFX9_9AGAR|nr:hypothetical protein C8F04DRAFT_1229252 [Mycena alexandri]